MKVLINATCIEAARATGIERFALHIAREFCRIDPLVTVVASESLTGITEVVIPKELATSRYLLGRRDFPLRAVWDQTIFRSMGVRLSADLVFFPIQDGMLYPPCKQIITVHDVDNLMPECRQEINPLRKKLYNYKMPHILQKSAAIVAVSQFTKKRLVNDFNIEPDKIHVIYNGYDEHRFRIIDSPQECLAKLGLEAGSYILFVGSILKHKNIVRLVKAFAELNSALCLVVAGVCKDSDYLEEIIKFVSECGLNESQFRYMEYVSDSDLPCLYAGARVFILPSLHEGFGVPIIEAMACGTPVITSNCSAMPEVAGDAAVYCDPFSVDSIAGAVRTVVGSQELRTTLTALGLERANKFRWRRSAQRLYRLFEEVTHT